MKDEQKLLQIAIKDLVLLATKTNNIVMQGSFPGSLSDEVFELLRTCKNIHETFVQDEDGKEED